MLLYICNSRLLVAFERARCLVGLSISARPVSTHNVTALSPVLYHYNDVHASSSKFTSDGPIPEFLDYDNNTAYVVSLILDTDSGFKNVNQERVLVFTTDHDRKRRRE